MLIYQDQWSKPKWHACHPSFFTTGSRLGNQEGICGIPAQVSEIKAKQAWIERLATSMVVQYTLMVAPNILGAPLHFSLDNVAWSHI